MLTKIVYQCKLCNAVGQMQCSTTQYKMPYDFNSILYRPKPKSKQYHKKHETMWAVRNSI